MGSEEKEIKEGFLEEGTSEMSLYAKRHRLVLPGAALSIFSFHPHDNNPAMIIAMIISTSQVRKLRPSQAKSFTQGSTARKQRSWDLKPSLSVTKTHVLISI